MAKQPKGTVIIDAEEVKSSGTADKLGGADPRLHAGLKAYRDNAGGTPRTNDEIGKELGMSGTYVSRYLTGKFEGDIERFEEKIRDLLRKNPSRLAKEGELFDTPLTDQLRKGLTLIELTNDFGLLYGEHGLGKSCAVELHWRTLSSTRAIRITLDFNTGGPGIVRKLWMEVSHKGWAGTGVTRMEWIADKLRGANRLILVDQAEKLTRNGFNFLMDLHRASGCPVALVGSTKLLDLMPVYDEAGLIGIRKELVMTASQLKTVAGELAARVLSGHQPGMRALAEEVAAHRGHLHGLGKQLRLTAALMTRGIEADGIRAFEMSHEFLAREYKLK